jgi:uncharacterized membrane protein required for colicin V production
MHWVDNTIVAVLAVAAVLGAYSGALMQLCRLLGLAVAIYAAAALNSGVTAWLVEAAGGKADERSCMFGAYGAVFIGVYLAAFLLTLLLERCVKVAQLQYLNRGLGAAFAVVKMGSVIGAVCYGLQQMPQPAIHEALDDSAMAPMLVKSVEQAVLAVPEEYKTELVNRWNQVREALPRNGKLSVAKPTRTPHL